LVLLCHSLGEAEAYSALPSLLKKSRFLSLLIYTCYFLQGALPLVDNGKSVIEVHQKKNYFIIPQNKLGQDIYIRATEIKGFKDIVKMPSGDVRPVKVPVLTNMLDSHLRGELCRNPRIMVTVIVMDAQVPFCLKQRLHSFWCPYLYILPPRRSCISFYCLLLLLYADKERK